MTNDKGRILVIMKKFKLITNPTKLSRSYLDSLYEYDDLAWEEKVERYQIRRLRSMRQELA
jgi:hypothetical protein